MTDTTNVDRITWQQWLNEDEVQQWMNEDKGLESDWKYTINKDSEESDWAYNWDFGIVSSTPCGKATLFLTLASSDDPMADFCMLVDFMNQNSKGSIECVISEDEDVKSNRKHVRICNNKNAKIKGYIVCKKSKQNQIPSDPNLGEYAVLTNENKDGYALMAFLKTHVIHRARSFIDHSAVCQYIMDGVKMRVVTGVCLQALHAKYQPPT